MARKTVSAGGFKVIDIINKSLFTAEGEYSDIKNLVLSFVVDQTAPVLTITGLESGGRYQTDEQKVMLIPTDEGGRLNSLKVVVLNSDGNPLKDDAGADISVRFDMSGEELRNYLEENNGVVTFTVPKGLENQVHIICNDCALNADGVSNEYNEIFTKVTVSQNGWIIFYANKPLFYGTVAGVIALAALIIFLIARKKKKKDDK